MKKIKMYLDTSAMSDMTFAEENRRIREEQSIKMSAMTLQEKKDYVSSGAKQVQKRIEEMKKKAGGYRKAE